MAEVVLFTDYPIYSLENLPLPDNAFQNGAIFLIDKPKGWSSFKAVYELRKLIGIKKAGHAGTLDPMATGLLIICVGKATKSISQIQELSKRYLADIRFGASTPSYDADTEIDNEAPFEHITLEQIQPVLDTDFQGRIFQIPPMFSALKKDGKRLYKLAREGKTVERKPRLVTVFETNIVRFENPDLVLDVQCSKGTYIRSIADDLGRKLGSLAYLSGLRRTKIGTYSAENALSIAKLKEVLES